LQLIYSILLFLFPFLAVSSLSYCFSVSGCHYGISSDEIDKNIKKNFSFIHFGLVQVVVKPLTRQGLNISILLCLRDGRFKIYKDALLGMVESSLFQGPIYFNCYPNFVVSLTDETVL
jgi:hypothetical protein